MKTVYEIVPIQGVYMFEEPVNTISLDQSQFEDCMKIKVPFLDPYMYSKGHKTLVEAYVIKGRLYVE